MLGQMPGGSHPSNMSFSPRQGELHQPQRRSRHTAHGFGGFQGMQSAAQLHQPTEPQHQLNRNRSLAGSPMVGFSPQLNGPGGHHQNGHQNGHMGNAQSVGIKTCMQGSTMQSPAPAMTNTQPHISIPQMQPPHLLCGLNTTGGASTNINNGPAMSNGANIKYNMRTASSNIGQNQHLGGQNQNSRTPLLTSGKSQVIEDLKMQLQMVTEQRDQYMQDCEHLQAEKQYIVGDKEAADATMRDELQELACQFNHLNKEKMEVEAEWRKDQKKAEEATRRANEAEATCEKLRQEKKVRAEWTRNEFEKREEYMESYKKYWDQKTQECEILQEENSRTKMQAAELQTKANELRSELRRKERELREAQEKAQHAPAPSEHQPPPLSSRREHPPIRENPMREPPLSSRREHGSRYSNDVMNTSSRYEEKLSARHEDKHSTSRYDGHNSSSLGDNNSHANSPSMNRDNNDRALRDAEERILELQRQLDKAHEQLANGDTLTAKQMWEIREQKEKTLLRHRAIQENAEQSAKATRLESQQFVKKAREDVRKAQQDRDDFMRERDEVRAKFDSLEQERDDALENMTALGRERDDLLREVDAITAERNDEKTKKEGLQRDKDVLTEERDGLKRNMERGAEKFDELLAENDQLQQQLEDSQAAGDDISGKLKACEEDLEKLHDENRLLKEAADAKLRQIDTLEQTLESFQDNLQTLQKRYDGLEEEHRHSMNSCSERDGAIAELHEDLGQLEKERNEIQAESNAKSKDLDAKTRQLEDLESQLHRSQSQTADLEQQLSDMNRRVADNQHDLHQLRAETDNEITRLAGELEISQKKLDSYVNELNIKRSELEKVQKELIAEKEYADNEIYRLGEAKKTEVDQMCAQKEEEKLQALDKQKQELEGLMVKEKERLQGEVEHKWQIKVADAEKIAARDAAEKAKEKFDAILEQKEKEKQKIVDEKLQLERDFQDREEDLLKEIETLEFNATADCNNGGSDPQSLGLPAFTVEEAMSCISGREVALCRENSMFAGMLAAKHGVNVNKAAWGIQGA